MCLTLESYTITRLTSDTETTAIGDRHFSLVVAPQWETGSLMCDHFFENNTLK